MIRRLFHWLRYHRAMRLHTTHITPLGSLTYRQVNPHVSLQDGIQRARERTYFK